MVPDQRPAGGVEMGGWSEATRVKITRSLYRAAGIGEEAKKEKEE